MRFIRAVGKALYEILEPLDERLLAACTRFSHWLQRNFGISNYFVAKIGIAFAGVDGLLDIANYFHRILAFKSSIVLLFLVCPYTFLLIWRSKSLTDAETRMLSERDQRTLDPLLQSSVVLRVMFVGGLVPLLLQLPFIKVGNYPALDVFDHISFPFGLALYYCFVAVDPLPPGKSRVRQWLDSFSHVLVPARSRV